MLQMWKHVWYCQFLMFFLCALISATTYFLISKNFSQIWQCALDAKYGQRKHYRHVLSMTSNIVLYWILWTVCRHLKSSGIILAFSTQHEAYLSCIIAAFLRPTNSLYVCWNSKKIINIALSLQYECMYLRSKKRLGRGIFLILKRSYGLDAYFFTIGWSHVWSE